MTDIRLKEYASLAVVTMDWLLRKTGEIDEREELATAVRLALGTDATAAPNEILPDPDSTDRRGWWGDLEAEEIWGGWPIGCKNWLLTRAKISDAVSEEGATVERARLYTETALQHFIDKRVASRIDVQAARTGLERIEVHTILYRGPLAEIDLRYQMLWEEPPAYDPVGQMPVPAVVNRTITVPYRTLTLSPTAPTRS